MTERTGSAVAELDEHMDSQQGNGGQGKRKSKPKSFFIAAALVAVVVVAAIAGCSSEPTKTVTLEWLSVEVPEDWTVESFDTSAYSFDSTTYICPDDFEGCLYIGGPGELTDSTASEVEEFYEEYVEQDYLADSFSSDTFTEDGAIVQRFQYEAATGMPLTAAIFEFLDSDSYSTVGYSGYLQVVYSGDEFIVIEFVCMPDEYEEHADEMEDILDSMTLENPSAPE